MLSKSKSNLIWIDLEMTGLDFANDHIIEIATVVTSKSLKSIEIGPQLAISQPKHTLDSMNDWCVKNHTASGLYQRCLDSTVSIEKATSETLAFLNNWCYPQTSPLCGNSICTDRRFMAKEMHELDQYLHYRHIDVTTISLLARRWNFEIMSNKPNKKSNHLALDDILESIEELRYYKDNWLNS